MRRRAAENRHDRMELASEAGYSKVSLGSVLAGVLVAYGAFAILAALTGAVLSALGVDIEAFSDNDWREVGIASGVAVALILFLAYLYGGYVAGRMARRAGAANGLAVFVLGILVAAAVGAAVGSQTGADDLVDNIRSIGVPTSGDQFRSIGTFAGIGALVAMLLGSVLGGVTGERWHGKLVARALDPSVGTTADASTDSTQPVPVEGRHFGDAGPSDRGPDVTRTDTTLDDDLSSSSSAEDTRTMR